MGEKYDMTYDYLFTVPFQVETVPDDFKPFQMESGFARALCWRACFYEGRYIIRIDGLTVTLYFKINYLLFRILCLVGVCIEQEKIIIFQFIKTRRCKNLIRS